MFSIQFLHLTPCIGIYVQLFKLIFYMINQIFLLLEAISSLPHFVYAHNLICCRILKCDKSFGTYRKFLQSENLINTILQFRIFYFSI